MATREGKYDQWPTGRLSHSFARQIEEREYTDRIDIAYEKRNGGAVAVWPETAEGAQWLDMLDLDIEEERFGDTRYVSAERFRTVVRLAKRDELAIVERQYA